MKKVFLNCMLLLCALIVGSMNGWAAEGDEITSIANIVDGKSYYIKGVRTNSTYYLKFTDAVGSQSGTESSTKDGAQLITFHLQTTGQSNKVFTLETSSGKFIAPGTSNGKINVSASGINVTATNQSSKIRLSITSGGHTWSIQKNTSAANFGGYKNTQTDITLIEGPAASAVAKPTFSGLESFLSSTEVSISCATADATIQYSTNGGTTWNNYSTAFTLTETTTVQAKATKSGLTDSEVASKTFTKTTEKTVAEALTAIEALEDNGTISGYYVKGIVSTAGTVSSGKITYYISDDGTTTSQLQVYLGKGLNNAVFTSNDDIQLGDKVTVYGTVKKYVSGNITTPEFDSGNYLYSIVKKPTFSPAGGAIVAGSTITISSTQDGATIYYTMGDNPAAPTTSSTQYTGPITINEATTIKAISAKDGYPESSVAEATYTIAEPCETPTFSPAAGEVDKGTTVAISCGTADATIYYTTNGTTPSTSSTEYTGAITINSATTIKAIAVKDGLANSAVASADYTVIDYASLPFEFNGGRSNVESTTGLTQEGLDTDYSSSPKLKFNGAEDCVILKINEVPGVLTFDIKGNGTNTTPWAGTFKVQSSVNGIDYTDVATYTDLTTSTRTETIDNIASSVRYIKWIYTTKTIGNVALGNINLRANAGSITLAAACTDGEKYYGTYSRSSAFIAPTGITIAEIGITNGKLNVSEYSAGAVVPANTGVMVSSSVAGLHNLLAAASAGTSKLGDANRLRASGNSGISADDMAAADSGCKFYRLTMHNDSQIGFWWGDENGAAFNLTANKAYLAVPDDALLAPAHYWIVNEENGATNIENIEAIDKAVKFIENGRILIKKNGIVYDALGRVIR